MLGFLYQGPGQPAKLTDIPTPEAGPGEVRLKIGSNTVCGTDLRILRGDKTNLDLDTVLGHEIAGWIDQVGEGVEGFEVGQLATVMPSMCCGVCPPCTRGYEHLCDNAPLVGYVVDGGLAEYMLVPATAVKNGRMFATSNPDLLPEQVSLAEPLSCCIGGQNNYRVEVGDTVVIVGAGPIGLIHLQLAKLAGASQVIVSDVSQIRRETAEKFGADKTLDPTQVDLREQVMSLTGGMGADVAVLCIGRPELVNDCLRIVRKRGRVSIFAGLAKEGWSEIAANLIHYREITVTGASNSGRPEFEKAMRLIESGKIDTKSLVTHRFPLSKATEAIDFVATGEGIKVAVIPDQVFNSPQNKE